MYKEKELQLLPQDRNKFHLNGIPGPSGLLVFSIIFSFVVATVFIGLSRYISVVESEILEYDESLSEIQKNRSVEVEQKLANFSKQLSSINVLIGKHISASRALTEIQRSIEGKVKMISIDLDSSQRQISMRAYGDSYSTIAKQVSAFYRSPLVSDLSLSKVESVNRGGVEFSLVMMINQEGFK